MKRVLTWSLLALLLAVSLPSCGCGDMEADLVFVNGSDAAVTAVLADFADQGSVAQNADSSPLKRGESFGFEAGEYPVTVMVYDQPFEDFGQEATASITISHAPSEGNRWYVTAQNGETGLMLTADTCWPEGV